LAVDVILADQDKWKAKHASKPSDQSEASDALGKYIATLHDLTGAYHERLIEVTSPQVAAQLLRNLADKAVQRFEIDREKPQPMKQAKELISSLGIDLRITQVGSSLVLDVSCPFAQTVHRLLNIKPVCPIGLLVLGTMRIAERDATISSCQFSDRGLHCTISTQR